MDIRVIALDLDGTLLNSQKLISPADYDALARAAERGVHIVPTTGRFYDAMPEVVRQLPFVRYAITVNGAEVYDAADKKVLHRAELEPEQALEVYRYFSSLPGICDCYVEGWGYMERSHYGRIDEFSRASAPYVCKMLKELRTPIDGMEDFIRTRRVQKLMVFFQDMERRALELERVAARFPDYIVTSSIVNNIEVNAPQASKGEALRRLCAHLGLGVEQAMSFGDGSNDLSMIRAAGVGVAMANAYDGLKQAADFVTLSCDEGGVAHAIDKFVFGVER